MRLADRHKSKSLKLAAWASDRADRYCIVAKGLGIAPPASFQPSGRITGYNPLDFVALLAET